MAAQSSTYDGVDTLRIAIPKETAPDEDRVALVPEDIPGLVKEGHIIDVEAGAGEAAGYPDAEYKAKGARIISDRLELIGPADILLQVRGPGTTSEADRKVLENLHKGQAIIAFLNPLGEAQQARRLAATGVTSYSMELIPRLTHTQSMDALSSMATLAGYKAVLLGAAQLPKMFPMMITAAGTLTPARVFVLGAGVAGLQAIASAKRLGAMVAAYDIRPETKEQVQSVGGQFIEIDLDTRQAKGKGGYAREQSDDFIERQRQMMLETLASSDLVITTAAVPGKKAPVLITGEMVQAMRPGSVIVDLAAEQGGNCQLTSPGETVEVNGVAIMGPRNIPGSLPTHASKMYSRNITTLLRHLLREGQFNFPPQDEVDQETMVTHDGQVVHTTVLEILGEPPSPPMPPSPEPPLMGAEGSLPGDGSAISLEA